MTLLYWEWLTFRSIFAWFLEQLLKDLVSWGSHGECSMIDRFWEMLSGFCPARFGVLFCSVVLGCRYTPKTTLPCSQWCPVPGGVFDCDIARRRSDAVLCMLYKIGFNPMHPLNDVLHGPYVSVRVTRGALVAHRYTYCWPRIRWCGTGGFQEQGQCFFIGLSCSIPIFPFLFQSIGWYYGAGVFGLIGCISLSLSLALPTSFNK